MYAAFKTLPETSKIWIYPCSRKFYQQETEELTEKIKNFVINWKTDSPNFKASFKLLYNRFIIFSAATNISLTNTDVDKQVAFILGLEKEYNVTLLDKMNVCFKQGNFVQYKELKEFKKLLKNKAVSNKTIVFDNLIETKQELEHYWEIPITASWYKRFL